MILSKNSEHELKTYLKRIKNKKVFILSGKKSFFLSGADKLFNKKDISITIYDFNGKYIKSIMNYDLTPGTQTVRWDGTDQFSRPVAAGMYLYLIEGRGFRQTGKMIYLK